MKQKLHEWTRPVKSIDYSWIDFLKKNRKKKGLIVGSGTLDYSQYGVVLENVVFSDIVKTKITNILCDVQNMPFKEKSFEWVYSSAVLEHVPNMFQAADEMVRVLKNNGELFCAIPFMQPYHPSPNDYWRVTKEGMRHLFRDLEEIKLTTGSGAVSALLWMNMRFIYNLLPRKLDFLGRFVIVAMKPLHWMEKTIDRINMGRKEYDGMQGMASGYHFIGRKKPARTSR